MCGIAGFYGRYSEAVLRDMNESIAHRGPDDEGILWIKDKGIGLAHKRLSIIDTSINGRQPMWDVSRRVAIVFNGEIYNFPELRRNLIDVGYSFNSHSDTEVLLNLYLEYGESMFSKLNGIFAFALWDARKDTMLLARDGMGVKPLYYSKFGSSFLFASEIKAILRCKDIEKTIDPTALHYYLRYLWCPAPKTMLKNVHKLEPGHALIVRNGNIEKKWQFYDIPYNNPIENISENDAVALVRERLEQAVKRQMISDVPVGAFLSGGLDSSAVVAFASRLNNGEKLKCFTIGFKNEGAEKEGFTDDLPYAQRVAKHLNVDLHTVYADHKIGEMLEQLIYHLDEPQADLAPINVLYISQLAKKNGIKVLLSGAGGDDIFTGYRRHYALMLERYWKWMPKIACKSISSASQFLPASSPFFRRLKKLTKYAHLGKNESIASYFYWIDPEYQATLYSQDFMQSLGNAARSEPLLDTLSNLKEDVHPLNKMLYLEGKHFLPDHNLNYTDKMSMATGVEVRVPLLDIDLVDLATRLPIKFKQNGRIGKWIMKKAMMPYLPEDVIFRPKTGFPTALRLWLKKDLKPNLDDLLSETSINNRGVFDFKGVRNLIEDTMSGKLDGFYTIFSLMCIELWFRIFVDGHIPSNKQ